MGATRGSVLWWLGMEESKPEEKEPAKPYVPDPRFADTPFEDRNYEAPTDLGWTEAQREAYTDELIRLERFNACGKYTIRCTMAREWIERQIVKGKM